MKTNYFALTFMLSAGLCSQAQNFQLLGNDPQGDLVQPVKDLKALHYAIDFASDSLWLKIETHNSLNGDVGMAVAFDTDLDTSNGNAWGGYNQSMKYEKIIFLSRNAMFQPEIVGSETFIKVKHVSEYEIIVNLPLSEIDNDGKFNIIAGTGGFDLAYTTQHPVFEEIPNSGFFSIDITTSLQPISEDSKFNVYPSVFRQWSDLKIQNLNEGNYQLRIFGINGQLLLDEKLGNAINLQNNHSGIYIIEILEGQKIVFRQKVIKMN